MKILVVSFYYFPDLGPASIRLKSLCQKLAEENEVSEIEVVTTMPNRYATYTVNAASVEVVGKTVVRRVRIPKHDNKILVK